MANGRLKTASFGPAFLGVILVFCGFAAVAWILFRFSALTSTYEDQRAKNRQDKAAAIAQEAQEKLYGPAKWIDKAKGTVQLPIDTAMDLVVADYQGKAVHASSVPVDNPYPAGLQTPPAPPAAAAASPAAAASSPAAVKAAASPAASPTPEVKP